MNAHPKATGFHKFHADPNINYQLNRFLISGRETLFAAIGSKVEDFDDWRLEFLSRAYDREADGDFREAAWLYRAAEFFLRPDAPDRRLAYEKFIELFYRVEPELASCRLSIPYGTGTLRALRLKPPGASRGAILIHAGYDAYIEEFVSVARAFCRENFDVVMFDGPGQGSTLMQEGIPMTPQWELPVAAVLDHLRIIDATLIGISLGGCLALRAAAFEPRVKRVIAFDVMLDFFECVTSRRGRLTGAVLSGLMRLRARFAINALARLLIRYDLYSRWGIEQGMHVFGCSTPADYFRLLTSYETRSISSRVTQDVFVMAGAEDHFVPLHQFHEQVGLLSNARSVTGRIFTREEHAQSHCQIGNLELATAEMIHWLDLCGSAGRTHVGGPRPTTSFRGVGIRDAWTRTL
jgi:alpha-beta hydrolase superfamily lysophospholipase